ncbi:hypothetical protein FRB93_005698 [Tulasnella sp. JGI-2019a]|nr:hypothetical protein FRB93_005698 [Tulasnella sp. JGI-2019a]
MMVYLVSFLYCLNLISSVSGYPVKGTIPEEGSQVPQRESSPQGYHRVKLWRTSLNPSSFPEIFPEILYTEAEDLETGVKEGEIIYKLNPKWPGEVLREEATSVATEQQPAVGTNRKAGASIRGLDPVFSSLFVANWRRKSPVMLSPQQKRKICELFYLAEPSPTRKQLAQEFNVCPMVIGNIVKDYERWVNDDL